MKIYTSYFAKLKSLPADIIPISICGKAPLFYKGIQYKTLAPKYEFFMQWKADHDNDKYTQCYQKEVLDELDAQTVLEKLSELSEGKDVALICYEKASDFCHRHLVADWLCQHGQEVEEWKPPEKDTDA
jgi:uncharacterized protein (DUF488 family)